MSGSKSTGREIGGISQFATLGGAKAAPPATGPASEQEQPAPAKVTASHQPTPRSKTATEKRERERLTVYLPPDLAEWIRVQAASGRKEISEIVEAGMQEYRSQAE